MDRLKFRDFLHNELGMTDDIIMDRIFKHFNKIAADDIDLEEWIMGFNIFLKGEQLDKVIIKLGGSYCPEPFRTMTSYFPEPFWKITISL